MQGTVDPGGRRAPAGRSSGREGFGLTQGESPSQSGAEPCPGITRWATHAASASPQRHGRRVLCQSAGCRDRLEGSRDVELSTCVLKAALDSTRFPPPPWPFPLSVFVFPRSGPRGTPTSPPWRSPAPLLLGRTEFSRLIFPVDLLLTWNRPIIQEKPVYVYASAAVLISRTFFARTSSS